MSTKVFTAAITEEAHWQTAAETLLAEIKGKLGGKACHLAIFFVSEPYTDLDAKRLLHKFEESLQPHFIIGCNSSGVIGGTSEIEMRPAISLMAMHIPAVSFTPFSITRDALDKLGSGQELIELLDLYPTDRPNFIMLSDPMSCDVNKLLRLFNEGYPASPIVGGLASGAVMGCANWLALKGGIYHDGMVGIALTGDIAFDIVVAQGCRPIGPTYAITRVEDNVLFEIAGRPVLEVLNEMLSQLDAQDRELARHALFMGIVMKDKTENLKRGDFLIRNIMGMDRQLGALVVGEKLRSGQIIQFQLRDARASKEDLTTLLGRLKPSQDANREGAFLVACCGRGRGLYGEPDHDVNLVQSLCGPLPLTGFFANGELAPINNKNYIHGFTSSLTILR